MEPIGILAGHMISIMNDITLKRRLLQETALIMNRVFRILKMPRPDYLAGVSDELIRNGVLACHRLERRLS